MRTRTDSEFFPKKLAKEANRKLELLLAEKSEEIEARNRDLKNLMQNVPGGIFRCLDDESLTIRQMRGAVYGSQETRFNLSKTNLNEVTST